MTGRAILAAAMLCLCAPAFAAAEPAKGGTAASAPAPQPSPGALPTMGDDGRISPKPPAPPPDPRPGPASDGANKELADPADAYPEWLSTFRRLAPPALGAILLLIGALTLAFVIGIRRALKPAQIEAGQGSELLNQLQKLTLHIGQMHDRIGALEREIQRLRGAGPAAPAPAPDSRGGPRQLSEDFRRDTARPAFRQAEPALDPLEPPPFPSRPAPASSAPQPAKAHETSIHELMADPEVRRMMLRYNQMAATGDRGGLQAFEHEFGAFTVSQEAEGLFSRGDGETLWFAPAGDAPALGVLLPGPGPIKRWDKFYRELAGEKAKSDFGDIYDLLDGPHLQVIEPAWAERRAGDQFFRVRSGRLSGI